MVDPYWLDWILETRCETGIVGWECRLNPGGVDIQVMTGPSNIPEHIYEWLGSAADDTLSAIKVPDELCRNCTYIN